MPWCLEAAAKSVPAGLWTTRDKHGGFSFVEHACHLRDIEAEGHGVRLRRMLSETSPMLPDLDGGKLAEERDYLSQDFETAFAAFSRARAEIVRRLEALSAAERRRTGILERVGEITVDGLVARMLEHDGEHRHDFEALRDYLFAKREQNPC